MSSPRPSRTRERASHPGSNLSTASGEDSLQAGVAVQHTTFCLVSQSKLLAVQRLPGSKRRCQVSSPGSMTMLTRRIQRNYVEQDASVVYRQGSCIERSFDAHFLEFVAFSFVWAESFER